MVLCITFESDKAFEGKIRIPERVGLVRLDDSQPSHAMRTVWKTIIVSNQRKEPPGTADCRLAPIGEEG